MAPYLHPFPGVGTVLTVSSRLVRFDRYTLPRSVERTGAGAIRVGAAVARVGVQEYSDGVTSWKEFRSPEEVFAPASLASARGVPVTIGHEGGLLSPVTVRTYQHGHAGDNPRADGDWLHTDLIISAADAIRQVESRELCEISAGYSLGSVRDAPGVWRGEHYDKVQCRITYNHFTLLPPGHARAGTGARVHLDSSRNPVNLAISVATLGARNIMNILDILNAKARFDNKEYDLSEPEQQKAFLSAYRTSMIPTYRADALDAATAAPLIEAMKGSIDTLVENMAAMMDALRAGSEVPDVAGLEDMIGVEVMDSLLTQRAAVIAKAEGYDVETTGQTAAALMRAVAVKAGRMDATDKTLSPEIVRGIFIGLPDSGKATWSHLDQATINSGAAGNANDPAKTRSDRRALANNWAPKK